MTDHIVVNGKTLPITKIWWKGAVQLTLTDNYGGQQLGCLNQLAALANEELAHREISTVSAVALGGPSRKHMWGIEAKIDDGPKPDGYLEQASEIILSGGL